MPFSRECQLAAARLQWIDVARAEQLPPEHDSWDCFLFLGGRGCGKTRCAAEWLAWEVIKHFNSRWAIVAPTMATCISVCVEGESGILSVFRRYGFKYEFLRSRGEIILENNSIISLFSAEEPERMRGPQFHGAWFDELAAFATTNIYDLAIPALRLGSLPKHIITTTPKPIPLIVNLAKIPNEFRIVKTGSTFDNEKNLAPGMIRAIRDYFGTSKLARQELYGELLNELDGSLFVSDYIDSNRSNSKFEDLSFYQISIGVDPAVTFGEDSAKTGVVVVGKASDGHLYVLEDATLKGKPEEWAAKVNELYKKYSTRYQEPVVVPEINNGGEMVVSTLKFLNPNMKIEPVRATDGKQIRAEPISLAYSKGMVHHLGNFPDLEAEMLYWIPGKSSGSPDRLDALVWAVTYLIDKADTSMLYFFEISKECKRCKTRYHKKYRVCPNCHDIPS